MNRIEFILENSVFSVEQFRDGQIATLNEMANDISYEQLCIIAHPEVTALTYSVLYDYLSKGNSITSKEYQKYLSIDANRINDIIVNVYLGKLHGLSDEQINLYAQRSVYNIKIARLLIEKSKDVSPEQLSKLLNGKFGTKSIVGKQAIQDYINNELSLEQLLALSTCENLTQDNYDYIKNTTDSRILRICSNYFEKKLEESISEYYIKQSLAINNNDTYVDHLAFGSKYLIKCDSIETFEKLYKSLSYYTNDKNGYITKFYEDFNYNFTKSNIYIKIIDLGKYHDEYEEFYIVKAWYDKNIISGSVPWYKELKLMAQKYSSLKEYLNAYVNTNKFDKINDLIRLDKNVIDYNIKGYSYELSQLFALYTSKQDKETEISYLDEHLKDAPNEQINEVLCMKKNKCSNDEIHLYIEKYLSCTTALPTMYYIKDYDYNKDFSSISEFLQLNKFDDMKLDDVIRLKEAKCTDEEIQYCCTHNIKLNSYIQVIQRELLNIVMKNNWDNLYITLDNDMTKTTIDNYNFAVANFKNKPKSIKQAFCRTGRIIIKPYLIKYIDNFDDDTFSKLLSHTSDCINFYLKMSSITTDYNTLKNIYESVKNIPSTIIENFNDIDEKVTKDVIIKFYKDAKIDMPKGLFDDQVESVIEKSVEYFGSSKNFKPIQYDDETIYVDIIGNKELKGSHIITFNKEENDNYEYIFEIAHKEDTLTYTSKITTKKDVTEAINKSIALIENIDEYKEYTEELQEMLKSI